MKSVAGHVCLVSLKKKFEFQECDDCSVCQRRELPKDLLHLILTRLNRVAKKQEINPTVSTVYPLAGVSKTVETVNKEWMDLSVTWLKPGENETRLTLSAIERLFEPRHCTSGLTESTQEILRLCTAYLMARSLPSLYNSLQSFTLFCLRF